MADVEVLSKFKLVMVLVASVKNGLKIAIFCHECHHIPELFYNYKNCVIFIDSKLLLQIVFVRKTVHLMKKKTVKNI